MMLALPPMVPTTLFDARMIDALRFPPSIFTTTNEPSLRPLKDGRGYALTVAAPGVRAKDLSVSVKDGVLSINGETKSADYTHVVNWATRVPRDADVENGTASHADGLLTISIPIKPAAEPIEVGVSTDDAPMGDDETESDDEEATYKLTLEAPGVAASDLAIVAKDGVLSVSGVAKRTGAKFAKTYRLPRDADATWASASHVDGLLTISIPKREAAKETKVLAIRTEVVKDSVSEMKDGEEPEMI